MKRALVLFALLLPLFTPPAFGGAPELNVKAVCNARSADAKMVQSPPDQSTADCVRDEEAAKQQLGTLWASTSVSIRNRCESDAHSSWRARALPKPQRATACRNRMLRSVSTAA